MITGAPANVLDYGATGNGVADDSSACVLANAASTSIFFPSGSYYIDNNITLTASITMEPDAKFIVAAGKILTINGAVYAGSRQYIFQGNSGAFAGTFGFVTLWVDWFGAAPDSTISATPNGTDSGLGINKAIVAANNGGTRFGNIKFNSGVYLIETPVISTLSGIVMEGAGKYNTILICKTAFTGSVVTLAGSAGPPNVFRGFGVIGAVGGAFGALGIDVQVNGSFVSDIWSSGFATAVTLSSTDQLLSDFAIELNINAINCTSSNILISNGIVYNNQAAGVLIDNSATLEPGAITISNVKSTQDAQVGFLLANAKNVILDSCSVSHINAGSYTIAGFKIEGTANNIQLNGCLANLGAQATSAVGFSLGGSGNYNLSDCVANNFYKGIFIDTPGNITVNGGIFTAKLYGIHAVAYNFLSIANTQCNYNGPVGASDAGIFIEADKTDQRTLLLGNLCGTTGGSSQDYGIHITCTNAASFGIATNNITPFNTVAGLLVDGANSANFTLANNIN
jgi:hypothetical protein